VCALVWVAVFLLASGCGYHFVRYQGGPGGVHSVAIHTLRNESYEPGVEFVVSDALRREFLRRGAVDLTEDLSRADLVLSGAVDRVSVDGRSFDSVVLATEFQLTLGLDLEAVRRDGSSLAIDPRALRETERYFASADIEATRKNRSEAIRRLATLLAGRLHDAVDEALAP
jgi:outer membrane lipopolysaccharide assembly protein LptE/RlpB